MGNQIIPIKITATPVPVTVSVSDINQLLQLASQYFVASISADVSFFLEVSSTPTSYMGDLVFNTSARLFMAWDTGVGGYLPVTDWNPGDTKQTFVAGDEISQGWVVLDGRAISAIPGLSANQQSVLYQLFGLNSNLPTVNPLQSLVGMPAAGAFNALVPPATQPPSGQIGGLQFSGDYNPSEEQALAANTETLRGSAATVNDDVGKMAALMETMLSALNGSSTGPKLYAKVYCGVALA